MGKEWLTDEQRWVILEALYDRHEPWQSLADRLGVPRSAVTNFSRKATHAGWTCTLDVTPCQFCGEKLLTKLHYRRTLVHSTCLVAITSRRRALEPWTAEDDHYLMANTQTDVPLLAEALDRTYLETVDRMRLLQREGSLDSEVILPIPPQGRPGTWSVVEDLYLIRHAADKDRELAEALGRSLQAVSLRYAKLVNEGLIAKGSRRWKPGDSTVRVYHRGPNPQTLPLLHDLRQGLPIDRIAHTHGKSLKSLRALARTHGITPTPPTVRPNTGPKPETKALLDDIEAGLSYEAIAAKYGKSPTAIHSAAYKYGLTGKQAGRRRKIPRPASPTRLR
jgi:hypothetical protein